MLLPRDELDAIEAALNANAREVPEMDRTMTAQWQRFGIALHRLVWTIAEESRIVRLRNWLAQRSPKGE